MNVILGATKYQSMWLNSAVFLRAMPWSSFALADDVYVMARMLFAVACWLRPVQTSIAMQMRRMLLV